MPRPQPVEPRQDLRGLSVLIVDDNATNREILHHQVIDWGMKYDSTEGGAQALDMLRLAAARGEPYELVILDMNMPGMDGLELARAIKMDSTIAAVRLVMLTSLGLYGDMHEVHEVGIVAYLNKPVRQSQLYHTLVTVMSAAGERRTPQSRLVPQISNETGAFVARVLLAEDNPVNQEVALGMLECLQLSVDVVTNGHEAIAALDHTAYALVLMDCEMPEMDGLAATRVIRQREMGTDVHLPIVALTAHALPEYRDKCLAAGMDGYLSKPFNLNELRATLRPWLPQPEGSAPELNASDPIISISSQPCTEVDQASTAPVQSANPIDRKVLQELQAIQRKGKPDIVVKMIRSYLNSGGQLVHILREAASNGDVEALEYAAHTLKSSSANIGARTLASVCQQLENAARDNTFARDEETVSQIETLYATVVASLSTELDRRTHTASEAGKI